MKNRSKYLIAMAATWGICGTLLRIGYNHPHIIIPLVLITPFACFGVTGYFKEWWSLRPYICEDGTTLTGEAAQNKRKGVL